MNKKKDRTLLILVLCIAAACIIGGCVGALLYRWNGGRNRGEPTETGFIDKETGITYVMCNPLAVKPVAIETDESGKDRIEIADDGKHIYYKIRYEDPERFLCDLDEETGSSYVFRAEGLPDITLANFDAVSAALYLDGKTPVAVLWLYADDEYLPAELKGQNPTQDTALVRQMTDALVNGEGEEIADDDILDGEIYHFRLFSNTYPGLYYDIALFETTDGKHYIEDMATFKKVLCPEDVEVRVLLAGS